MAGLLILSALLAGAATADDDGRIAIMVRDLFDERSEFASRYYGIAYVQVSPNMKVQDLLQHVNFHPGNLVTLNEVEEKGNKEDSYPWDKNAWFNERAKTRDYGASNELFQDAYYCGTLLDPSSTLQANGIMDMSMVLLRKQKDQGKRYYHSVSRDMILEVKLTLGEEHELKFFYTEPIWNVFNCLSHKSGVPVKSIRLTNMHGLFQVEAGELQIGPLTHTNYEWVYTDSPHDGTGDSDEFGTYWVGHMFAVSPVKRIFTVLDLRSGCSCLGESDWTAATKDKMSRSWQNKKFGMGCKAHDVTTKACNKRNIVKGNRKCWCPKKWCYTTAACGTPSVQFDDLYYSYSQCDGGKDCFAGDDEGTETVNLNDFDIWSFSKLRVYMSTLIQALGEYNDELKKKIEATG